MQTRIMNQNSRLISFPNFLVFSSFHCQYWKNY